MRGNTKTSILILLGILLIAAFFRFYQLDAVPPGLYPDEAINGNEAITNPGQIFYPENNGREGLFMNLLWLSFQIFGISVWSFRVVPAIIGVLTVWGLYLFIKELFGSFPRWRNEALALLASFFLATSFWHINFSRIGFRAILLPFILVFSFYFLFRAFRTKRILDFILAGILFGLGFYTYTSFRMAVLLLPIPLIYFWLSNGRTLNKQFLILASLFLILVFIVALPIGIYFLQNPEYFASRAVPISVFAQENPLFAFGKSLIGHLAIFNIYGDPNWRHNYAGSPQLLWPVGIVFLLGIIITLRHLVQSIQKRASYDLKKHSNILKNVGMFFSSVFSNKEAVVYLFLWSWLLLMLLPGVLTYEGIPHALRTIGVLPIPYIFAAIGGLKLYDLLIKRAQKRVILKILHACIALFFALLAASSFYTYFFDWAHKEEVKNAFGARFVNVGSALNDLPDGTRAYVIKSEGDLPTETPIFIQRAANKNNAVYIGLEDISHLEPNSGDVILTMNKEDTPLPKIMDRFPAGQLREFDRFWIYQIY